jgi:hypothetical protein
MPRIDFEEVKSERSTGSAFKRHSHNEIRKRGRISQIGENSATYDAWEDPRILESYCIISESDIGKNPVLLVANSSVAKDHM